MLKNIPNFKELAFLPRDEYLEKANEQINAMVREQIHVNIARNALYCLIFILDEEREGLDSFRIVEHLKSFFKGMADTDLETGRMAEQMLKQAEEFNARMAEKGKPGMKPG